MGYRGKLAGILGQAARPAACSIGHYGTDAPRPLGRTSACLIFVLFCRTHRGRRFCGVKLAADGKFLIFAPRYSADRRGSFLIPAARLPNLIVIDPNFAILLETCH